MIETFEKGIRQNHIERYGKVLRFRVEMNFPSLEVVKIAVELASLELNTDPPRVHAMDQADILKRPTVFGYAPFRRGDNVIAVRMGQCGCRIAKVAAHECRHRLQIDTGKFLDMLGKGTTESDAEKFADEFFTRHLAGTKCRCRISPLNL